MERTQEDRDPILRDLHAYLSPERVKSFAFDIVSCGPPAFALSASTAETGLDVVIAGFPIAKCIPDLMSDTFFPAEAMQAAHTATSMLTSWGLYAAIAGGITLGSDYVTVTAAVANAVHNIVDFKEAYPLGVEFAKSIAWFDSTIETENRIESLLLSAQYNVFIPSLLDDPFWRSGDQFISPNS